LYRVALARRNLPYDSPLAAVKDTIDQIGPLAVYGSVRVTVHEHAEMYHVLIDRVLPEDEVPA
jgi:hypothetical protein